MKIFIIASKYLKIFYSKRYIFLLCVFPVGCTAVIFPGINTSLYGVNIHSVELFPTPGFTNFYPVSYEKVPGLKERDISPKWCFKWSMEVYGQGFACGGIDNSNSNIIKNRIMYAVKTHEYNSYGDEYMNELIQPSFGYIFNPLSSSPTFEPEDLRFLRRIHLFADSSDEWSAYILHHGDNVLSKLEIANFLHTFVFEGGFILLAILIFVLDVLIALVGAILKLFSKKI